MNIERMRKIIQYSDKNRRDIEAKVRDFYSFSSMNSDKEVLNIMQIARPAFKKRGFMILELPFADEEIGAFCYRGDALGYIVINSALPKVKVNFAICHELYHVFYHPYPFRARVEFAKQLYCEQEEEYAANLFAGILLMPEAGFRIMYLRFLEESEGDVRDTLIRLMNYYQVPYMAVLIRCYELGLVGEACDLEQLLATSKDEIRKKFEELWLDIPILDATKKDDYRYMEAIIQRVGHEYVENSYLSNRTLDKVLGNMHRLYRDIRG